MYKIEEIINTIICGECVEELKKIPDNSIDIVITSPPYNYQKLYDEYHDCVNWAEYNSFLNYVWYECFRVLKPCGRLCINIQPDFNKNNPTHHQITNQCLDIGFIWKAEIIWNKNHYNTRMSQFGSWKSPSAPCIKLSWEYIEIFCKESLKKIGEKENIDIERDEFLEYINGMWSFSPEKQMKKYKHPCVFPEELPRRLMKLLSYKGDIVLDPFNGVGTTSLVAKKNGRKYIGIEISEEYCKTAQERLSQLELL